MPKKKSKQGKPKSTRAVIDGFMGWLMTVKEFGAACEAGTLIDFGGMGDLVIGDEIVTPKVDGYPQWVKPSMWNTIPVGVTHVLWYKN